MRSSDRRTAFLTVAAWTIAVPLLAQIPRLPDGTPDLDGLWQGGGPIGDLAQGLAPDATIPLRPEAKRILNARQ